MFCLIVNEIIVNEYTSAISLLFSCFVLLLMRSLLMRVVYYNRE